MQALLRVPKNKKRCTHVRQQDINHNTDSLSLKPSQKIFSTPLDKLASRTRHQFCSWSAPLKKNTTYNHALCNSPCLPNMHKHIFGQARCHLSTHLQECIRQGNVHKTTILKALGEKRAEEMKETHDPINAVKILWIWCWEKTTTPLDIVASLANTASNINLLGVFMHKDTHKHAHVPNARTHGRTDARTHTHTHIHMHQCSARGKDNKILFIAIIVPPSGGRSEMNFAIHDRHAHQGAVT